MADPRVTGADTTVVTIETRPKPARRPGTRAIDDGRARSVVAEGLSPLLSYPAPSEAGRPWPRPRTEYAGNGHSLRACRPSPYLSSPTPSRPPPPPVPATATREATAACDGGDDSSLQGLDPCGVGDGEADPEAGGEEGSVRCRRRRRHGAGCAPTGGLGLVGAEVLVVRPQLMVLGED